MAGAAKPQKSVKVKYQSSTDTWTFKDPQGNDLETVEVTAGTDEEIVWDLNVPGDSTAHFTKFEFAMGDGSSPDTNVTNWNNDGASLSGTTFQIEDNDPSNQANDVSYKYSVYITGNTIGNKNVDPMILNKKADNSGG